MTFDDPSQPAQLPLRRRLSHGRRVERDTINVRTAPRHGPARLHAPQDAPRADRRPGRRPAFPGGPDRRPVRLADAAAVDASWCGPRTSASSSAALAMQQFPIMNALYADREGNIFFLYNGTDPAPRSAVRLEQAGRRRRSAHASGSGFHPLDELPQVLNPPSGYVQNCNSSPFTTLRRRQSRPQPSFRPTWSKTSDDDKRRAKISRQIAGARCTRSPSTTANGRPSTRRSTGLSRNCPSYARDFDAAEATDPALATASRRRISSTCSIGTAASTPIRPPATLCEAWYEEIVRHRLPGRDAAAAVRR